MELLQYLPETWQAWALLGLTVIGALAKVVLGSTVLAPFLPKSDSVWRKILDFCAFNFGNAENKPKVKE